MLILLNLVVVILLLVCIAMWATYGFFSAFIQLIIVIGAGVLAFALWEPVSHALLGRMPAYAHGVGLLAPFAILLIVLRVVFDKLCRANVHVPRLADQIGGAACGLGIGILAFGLVFNAVNFLPLQRDLMGWEPYKIRGNDVTANDTGHLWLNIHAWSGGFFTMLSGGSMHPTGGTPLVEARPALAKRALLYRMPPDSNQMRSAHPGSVSVTGLLAVPATEDAVRALALRSTLFAFLKPSYQVPSDIALGEDGLGLVRGLFNELDRRFEDSATHGKPSDMIDIDAIMKVSRTPQFTFPAATSRDNIEPFIDQVAEQIADDMVNRLRPVLGPGKMLYAVDTQWNNKFPGTFNTDGKLRVAISSVELQAKTNDGFEMIAPVGYSIEYSQNTGGRIFTEIISDQVDVDLRDSAYSRYTELSMGWFFVVPDGQTPERFFVRELRFDLDQLEDVAGQDSVVNQNIGAFARAMGAPLLPSPDDLEAQATENTQLAQGSQIAGTGAYVDVSEQLPAAFAAAATNMDLDKDSDPWRLRGGTAKKLTAGRGGNKNTVRSVWVQSSDRLVRVKLDGQKANSLYGRAIGIAESLNVMRVKDEGGNFYSAIGFAVARADRSMDLNIRSDAMQRGLSANELPDVGKGETLMVYFQVPVGKTITHYALGGDEQALETPVTVTPAR